MNKLKADQKIPDLIDFRLPHEENEFEEDEEQETDHRNDFNSLHLQVVGNGDLVKNDDEASSNRRVSYDRNIRECESTNKSYDYPDQSFVSFEKFKEYRKEEDFNMLLASTYVMEAANGRNGYFIPHARELRSYYWYNHKGLRLCLFCIIWINLSLALFESPAVPGFALPYWLTMCIELVCIVCFCLRLYHAIKFMPTQRHWKDKKIIIVFVCILLTLVDMMLAIVLKQLGYEDYAIRWTRVLRPAFMVNFSESRQVRRTVRNIRKTIPEISSVLVLFLLVIALYALLGVKLFEHRGLKDIAGQPYFTNYWDNYFNLYVLTTTANNPDLMIPAYNKSNWYALFFVVFTIICMYIFVSIFLAVVYKNYRTHLKNEVKASVYRKRRNMKAAFDCLKTKIDGKFVVTFDKWKQLIHFMKPKMNPIRVILYWKVLADEDEEYIGFKNFAHLSELLHVKMDTFDIRGHIFMRWFPSFYFSKVGECLMGMVKHRYFVYFFDLVIVVNAFCIALIDEDKNEIAFLILFNIEIFLKLITYGPKAFVSKFWNVFDTLVIGAASMAYILEALFQTLRYSQFALDLLLILRVLRLFKIIGSIRRFQVIINTILQIGPAIITYGGIMFVIYYVFAIIGMESFHNLIQDYPSNIPLSNLTDMQRLCQNTKLNGSEFTRLMYCEKNFNDILKAFMILFDLTVVNQWHVITDGYVRVTHKTSRIYFFAFHLMCVIVVLNIFVAFILEAFMLQFSLSKGNFEGEFEKKIEKGRATSTVGDNMKKEYKNELTNSLQKLDKDFTIADYLRDVGLTYKLRQEKTKNAELLLQQMFEDELDEKDFGPEFDDEYEDLEEIVGNTDEIISSERKLTLNTVDCI